MTRLLCVCLFLLSTSFGAQAEDGSKPWDFHGIQLGASEQSVLEGFPKFECKTDGPVRRCETYFKFSEHPGFLSDNGATNVLLTFAEDKLVNILVVWLPTMFEESYSKMKNVYGAPMDEKKEQLNTKDGRTFENTTATWHNGVSTIRYDRYWRNVGMSRILYMQK